jgi:DNA-binding MarR family transcriptional regulator
MGKSQQQPAHAGDWTFLTNHSHVLICLHRDPQMRLRDVADEVGITERAVQRIVLDLEAAGVLRRQRSGRRNVYHINMKCHLRHPLEGHCRVGELLEMVNASRSRR